MHELHQDVLLNCHDMNVVLLGYMGDAVPMAITQTEAGGRACVFQLSPIAALLRFGAVLLSRVFSHTSFISP